MNQSNFAEKYGIGQYRFAHAYDLAGKTFFLRDKTLAFDDRKSLSFCGERYGYECLKIEKDTYFVSFGDNAAVIDEASGNTLTVTADRYAFYGNEPWGFTDNMTGTGIRWTLGCGRFTDQSYISADKAKISWSPCEGSFAEGDAKYAFIKNGIYFVDIKSPVPECVCAPTGYDRLFMLQDYDHVMVVGCLTGKGNPPIAFSGYGKFIDL